MNTKKADKPHTPTFGVLRVPESRSPEYLQTLSEWGALPEVVAVPDAAGLLAALCKQNPAAILTVLSEAIETGAIRFWGLSHSHGWTEGLIRYLHRHAEKPRMRPSTATSDAEIRLHLEKHGRLHVEALGVNPRDAVQLLQKRGRKIPPELQELAGVEPSAVPPPAPVAAPGRSAWGPERLAELKAARKKLGTKAAADQFGISPTRVRQLLPGDAPPPPPNDPFGMAKRKA